MKLCDEHRARHPRQCPLPARALYGRNTQLVLMTLQPGEEIGLEKHAGQHQFIRIEAGMGVAVLDRSEHALGGRRRVGKSGQCRTQRDRRVQGRPAAALHAVQPARASGRDGAS